MSKLYSIYSILTLCMVNLTAPVCFASPTQRAPISMGVSSTWTGDSEKHSVSDNSGRQIAAVMPVAPITPITHSRVAPILSSSVVKTDKNLQHAKKPQVIKFTVPTQVDEAADVCQVHLKRAGVAGQQKAQELYKWVLAMHKHMSTTPVATPFGGPYPTPSFASSKLYYTREGRLKTVVNH